MGVWLQGRGAGAKVPSAPATAPHPHPEMKWAVKLMASVLCAFPCLNHSGLLGNRIVYPVAGNKRHNEFKSKAKMGGE